MSRAIIGIVALPMVLVAVFIRELATCRTVQLIVLAAILWSLTGCGVTSYAIEHDARSCHSEAWTVAAMNRCQSRYPQHIGTITDKLSQPLGELERAIQHRNHNHE